MDFTRKLLCSFLLITCCYLSCQAQNIQKVDNFISFAKAYGYVKYFHPSTEADQVDWGWFSVYGSKEVMECQKRMELLQTMQLYKSFLRGQFNPPADEQFASPAVGQVKWSVGGKLHDFFSGKPKVS